MATISRQMSSYTDDGRCVPRSMTNLVRVERLSQARQGRRQSTTKYSGAGNPIIWPFLWRAAVSGQLLTKSEVEKK